MKTHLVAFAAGAFLPSLVVMARMETTSATLEPHSQTPTIAIAASSQSPTTLVLTESTPVGDEISAPQNAQSQMPGMTADRITLAPAPNHLSADVDAGVGYLNEAMAVTPEVLTTMGKAVAEHGVAAFAYDVPVVKEQTNVLAKLLGLGLRHFAFALRDDMIKSVKESGIGTQYAKVGQQNNGAQQGDR